MAGGTARCGARGPYDLVFANILARPLVRWRGDLARNLAPGGTAILAGLLADAGAQGAGGASPARAGAGATLREGTWATLVLRRPG